MTDPRQLTRELFGDATTVVVPRAFLAAVDRLTAQATQRLGIEQSRHTKWSVFWVDGRILGVLYCEGEAELQDVKADEDVEISGLIIQLDKLKDVKLKVETQFDSQTGTSRWGRTLTVEGTDGDDFVFTASPNSSNASKVESFIDAVLDALARPGTSSA